MAELETVKSILITRIVSATEVFAFQKHVNSLGSSYSFAVVLILAASLTIIPGHKYAGTQCIALQPLKDEIIFTGMNSSLGMTAGKKCA